jgi:hypothetical protein
MLEDKIDFFLKIANLFGFIFEHGKLLNKTVIFPFQGANQELKRLIVASGGRTISCCISEWTGTGSVHLCSDMMKIIFN